MPYTRQHGGELLVNPPLCPEHCAVPYCAVLCCVVLCHTVLCCAVLGLLCCPFCSHVPRASSGEKGLLLQAYHCRGGPSCIRKVSAYNANLAMYESEHKNHKCADALWLARSWLMSKCRGFLQHVYQHSSKWQPSRVNLA